MEKRRHKRLQLQIPVTIRCNGRFIPATLVDVSCGGMGIKTGSTDIAKSDLIEVAFDLDDKRRDLSLRGSVARVADSEGHHIGIQFGNFFSESHKTLRQFLHQRLY